VEGCTRQSGVRLELRTVHWQSREQRDVSWRGVCRKLRFVYSVRYRKREQCVLCRHYVNVRSLGDRTTVAELQ